MDEFVFPVSRELLDDAKLFERIFRAAFAKEMREYGKAEVKRLEREFLGEWRTSMPVYGGYGGYSPTEWDMLAANMLPLINGMLALLAAGHPTNFTGLQRTDLTTRLNAVKTDITTIRAAQPQDYNWSGT